MMPRPPTSRGGNALSRSFGGGRRLYIDPIMMRSRSRGQGYCCVLLNFFLLFGVSYALGVIFLHFSASLVRFPPFILTCDHPSCLHL